MAYLLSHWRGRLPLAISLWVNMFGLLIATSYAEVFILSGLLSDPAYLILGTLIWLFFTRVIIFSWQLIGLFRAIEHDYLEHKNLLKTRALQALSLSTVVFTLVYSLDVIQGAVFYKQQIEIYSRPDAQVAYKLAVNKEQKQLTIRGGLDIGITAEVERIISANPKIESVVLQSRGGHIYEGRGLARQFIRHGINTYVYDECSSACSTAFIGGNKRYLGSRAKLGFHQYKIDMSKHRRMVLFYDLSAEQDRDRALFKSRGIKQSFLDKMFDQPADQIWFPDHTTLFDAGVAHVVAPTK